MATPPPLSPVGSGVEKQSIEKLSVATKSLTAALKQSYFPGKELVFHISLSRVMLGEMSDTYCTILNILFIIISEVKSILTFK